MLCQACLEMALNNDYETKKSLLVTEIRANIIKIKSK